MGGVPQSGQLKEHPDDRPVVLGQAVQSPPGDVAKLNAAAVMEHAMGSAGGTIGGWGLGGSGAGGGPGG